MLDVRKLRLLRELKHRGTLAAVAAALSYSPSAVSQQLTQLEAEAGVPLLEQVGRRVRLTAQAEILVAHTEVLLERLELAEADLAASAVEVTGVLRVATFQTVALTLLPPALSRLAERRPGLRVHVTELEPPQSMPGLIARDFDLAMGEEYPGHPLPRLPELERAELTEDPLTLAAPPAWGATTVADLAARPWVMEPSGYASRVWTTGLCRAAGFEPDVRFESTDLLLHARLVETGHAAAFLPRLIGAGLPLSGAPTRRIFTAVRRGAGRRPGVIAFREALTHAAG
ncbi:LysR family transcriptional regulator [Catenuloplanes japonicus]|uniref:LysR family transcriptional regulator n=1 Tax=Catenuloplanes japonicus TaxID=33876 RepID=UPI000526BD33|nr:LysR family transcriptional regulator [Catenuloplanes japonicus]